MPALRRHLLAFGIGAVQRGPNPDWGRYMQAYGILDGSLNYEVAKNKTVSFNASNILNKANHRYVGVPGEYTNLELQHFANGRTFNIGLRYKFGN